MIWGALNLLFNNASINPGEMAVSGPAAAVQAAGPSAKEYIQRVLEHPKTISAMKDAAMEWVREIPGVKALQKTGSAIGTAREVLNDVRNAPGQPAPGTMTIQPQALRVTTPPPLPGTPVSSSTAIPQSLPPAIPVQAPAIPVSPAAQVARPAMPVESTAQPAAWLDNETTGLPNERMMSNRAAKAQRFIKALGGTQNLPTNQSEWARLADQIGEKPPSLETQAQIEFSLNRRMVTKTETAGVRAETPAAVAKNPKALKIAQQLQEEMQRSGTAPSMPVSLKGNAVDIKSVGPGATVTLKNGKTVVVKELHPDGTFDY